MSRRAVVLDANLLIRAVLGKRVRELIIENAVKVKFFAPDIAYADARKYLPGLLNKRGIDAKAAMLVLVALRASSNPLPRSFTRACDIKRYSGSLFEMKTTGLF